MSNQFRIFLLINTYNKQLSSTYLKCYILKILGLISFYSLFIINFFIIYITKMSRTKNNKFLVPLVSSNDQKPRYAYDFKIHKQNTKKKALIKAYQNESPLLPKKMLKKPVESKIQNLSIINTTVANIVRNNRYDKKPDINQYLEEAKLHEEPNYSIYRRTMKKRPQSLLKIPQKSSVIEIRSRRERLSKNQQVAEMAENHSVDLFKIKQNKQQRKLQQYLSNANQLIPKAKILLETGKRLYKQAKFQEAEKTFHEAVGEDSTLLQSYYFLAIINLNNKDFERSIENLKKIIAQKNDYKKSVYLFLCISLKNANKNEQAIMIASQGIKIFPDYFDLILYRAKLYQLDNLLDLAQKDYDLAISIKDDSAQAYFKKGQCLNLMKQYKRAINILTTALYLDQGYKIKVLQQRAKSYLQTNTLSEAKKDIQKLISLDPTASQTYELKGYLQSSEGMINDAILSFEQAIKNNTSKKSLANSLIQITKFKIKDRDFYSAYHHICRSEFLQLNFPIVQMYKLFTEGVIFLMKRKINEGLVNLNKLYSRYPKMDEYLLKLFHLYRAYGYFVSNDHEKCLQDYYDAEKYQKKDRHSIYNMLLAEGIIRSKNLEFQKAFQYYDRAQALLPNKIQSHLYRAVNYVLMVCNYHQEDQIKKLQTVFLALKELDKAYDINNANSNLLFLRCLIYYYLGKVNQGLEDIGRAISKSEQNIPKYFFYRGLANGTLKNYKQCQNDFTICINLDENFEEAYLQRAKTFFLEKQIHKAMEDLQKYVEFRPKQNIHLLEGNLFFASGQIQEALKRYEGGLETKEILIMKSKCYISINQFKKALNCMKKLEKLVPSQFQADICILKLLILFSSESVQMSAIDEILEVLKNSTIGKNKIFGQQHVYHYLGICYFYQKKYQDALVEFNKAYKERQILNIEIEMEDRDMRDGMKSQQSQMSDFLQKEFNQINYNIFLCHLMMGEVKKAYELFIRDILPAKENVFQNQTLAEFSHLIFQNLKKLEKIEEETNQPLRELEVTLFDNALSPSISFIQIQLKSGKVKTKLCLLLPNMKMKDMFPQINPKSIIKRIKLIEVENRPQPPWVKRNMEENLIFTDQIQQMQNIEFNTEQNKQQEQEEQQQQENYDEEEDSSQDITHKYQDKKKINIDKMKKVMKLDDSIEEKLNKILNKAKKKEIQAQQEQITKG